jgi:hypothetical protein
MPSDSSDYPSVARRILFFAVWAALFATTILAITGIFSLDQITVSLVMVLSFVGDALLSALATGLFS